MADLVRDVLVDEHDRYVIPRREAVERVFDLRNRRVYAWEAQGGGRSAANAK